MEKKSLYDHDAFEQCQQRLDNLSADAKPQWGSMDAGQMMAHCAEILEVANGKELKNTPFLAKLFKGMIRKMVVGEKPYPKHSRTHPQYHQREKKDFAIEKQRLLQALQKFREMDGEEALKVRHPMFGTMTREEKGWSSFKHLDHHFNQFGV